MQTLIKQSKTKTGKNLLTNKIYWLNKLAGELPETNILTDYLRPESYRGKNKEISFELSAELSQAVIKLSNASSLSIYLLLLSTFNILLHKYTDNKDLIVGIPSYRSPSNASGVLPLRVNVNNQYSFKKFLLQVQENVISAYTHQDYSFKELLDLLAIPQAQNRCYLYDLVVLLENIHDRNCVANLNNDLTVSWVVNNSVIEGKIFYSQALFKDEAIATLVRHYLNVIESVIKNIDITVSGIVLCDLDERDLLVTGFNNNAKTYPVDKTIHGLFAQQVNRTTNEIAVVYNQEQLTYQKLSDRINKLAIFLDKLGITKGDLVGIYQARNINFLISILAILKAGAAYVPLDCTYPRDCLKYMLVNSEVKILLTQSSLLNLFADGLEDYYHLQHIICLDTNDLADKKLEVINLYSTRDIDRCEAKNIEDIVTGKDKAYTIYTSGSTGLPKGAIIRHDGAINHIYAQFDALELQQGFSFLQSAPASSDISVWQFLAPILFGGKTVIADKETICNPDRLFELIKQEKLTLVELVPVVLSSLLDYVSQLSPQERSLPDLQCMMITGEYVAVELVNRWLSLYPEIKVANAYGPTEASDDIIQYIITEPLPENQKTVPIGKPLANNNIYIVDSQMQLQPIGVPGEICVSGIGVGDGYWRNETKTQESFVPNPFAVGTFHETSLYKTGDLGRWLPGGNIEFLGRIDHQVKIRGFRIELGEIETILSQHPAVSASVVSLREDILEDKRLVAYIVPHKDDRTDELPTILRNFLKAKLPEYAIPSTFIFLDALPLTPSGKVDRRNLPAPEIDRDNREKSDILPRTPVEEVIAGVWSQVLKTDCVSINDNFFDRGGHSLLATQLISRLRQIFQIELPLRYVFEFPTIAELARGVESMKPSQNVLEIPPLVPVSRDSNLPLAYAQEGLWFIQQLNPDLPIYNSPAAVRLTGALNIPAFEKSLNEILQRHEALRTKFTLIEGKPVQVIVSDLTLKIPVISLENLPEAEREEEFLRLADKEAKLPFNLEKPPLIRVTLLKLSATDYVALFTMHHIATDGWSIAILIQELSTLYEAFSTELTTISKNPAIHQSLCHLVTPSPPHPVTPSPLPELTIQYADFAHWQRQWLQGKVLAEKLDYWKQQLAGIPPSLNLEKLAGNAPKTKQTRECAVRSFLLPPELSAKIRALSNQEGVTLFMTLLASFQTLLYRYT